MSLRLCLLKGLGQLDVSAGAEKGGAGMRVHQRAECSRGANAYQEIDARAARPGAASPGHQNRTELHTEAVQADQRRAAGDRVRLDDVERQAARGEDGRLWHS